MEQLTHIIYALEAATRDPASSLHFTPVKLRARADGWTPERQRLFVAALAAIGHAGQAAAWIGMTEQTAARLRHRDGAESFSRACAAAYGMAKRLRRDAAARARSRQQPQAAQGSDGSHRPHGSDGFFAGGPHQPQTPNLPLLSPKLPPCQGGRVHSGEP